MKKCYYCIMLLLYLFCNNCYTNSNNNNPFKKTFIENYFTSYPGLVTILFLGWRIIKRK